LLLLHGLFGSSANWHGIASALSDNVPVISVDLRNHGRSHWDEAMGYEEMACDLRALLVHLGIERVSVAGHSMGGKAAMWLALTHPERVEALVAADIAPVTYPGRFTAIIETLRELDLTELGSRREADLRLAGALHSPALRSYLLQNLVKDGEAWRWRLNLAALDGAMDELMSFPDPNARQYPGPALFVYGTESDYVNGEHLPRIRTLFPLARLRAVPNAGHWVYSDEPDAFVRALTGFLPG
jgi:pimeloyl-ACP methyl ester carboxylesterase